MNDTPILTKPSQPSDRVFSSDGGRDAALARALCLTLLLALVLLVSGCTGRTSASRSATASAQNRTDPAARGDDRNVPCEPSAQLQPPAIPAALTDPWQRAEYLAEHYWQHFDFADTTLLSNADYTEQAFVDFIFLLPNVSDAAIRRAVGTLLGSAAKDPAMFSHFTELAEQYLYDPNSPMRNEELYIPFLEAVIALPSVDSLWKIRPRHQLRLALKNRPGAGASDFVYTTAVGRTGRLSALRANYTLILFYDPDCPDCKRVKGYISDSQVFGALIGAQDGRRLSVLAVYPDADLDAWRSHLSEMPPTWTVGYDKAQQLRKEDLYDLKALPTLYLLDRDKRVVLKDAPVESVEAWLAQTMLEKANDHL